MTQPSPRLDFDTVLRNTHHRIRAYIAGLGAAAHDVDKIAEDVYFEFYNHQNDMPDDIAPQRWLTEIARNHCLAHIHRHAHSARLQREALAEILGEAETETHRHATEGTLTLALEECRRQLPDDSRRVIELRFQRSFSSTAIAEELHTTIEAIRLTLFRIRASLKTCVLRQIAGSA